MNHLNTLRTLRASRVLPTLAMLAYLGVASPVHAQARYSYSSDGAEVTDGKTGLVWRRCSQGQSWSGSSCSGSASIFTHEQALVLAKTQAGWRLPNVKELASLVDRSRSNPTIDVTAFPATPSSYFWSASPDGGNAGYGLSVLFHTGEVLSLRRSNDFHVRLVR